jgi:hypothetical protein
MANALRGEKTIQLNHIEYPMVVNMNVINSFETETGKDFMHCTAVASRAYLKCLEIAHPLDVCVVMTDAVPLKTATWLIYLAAKEANSQVEFGEIQEQLFLQGALDMSDGKATYPQIFIMLTEYAIMGEVTDEEKKPIATNNGEPTLSKKSKHKALTAKSG